jgi:hypothetical protein
MNTKLYFAITYSIFGVILALILFPNLNEKIKIFFNKLKEIANSIKILRIGVFVLSILMTFAALIRVSYIVASVFTIILLIMMLLDKQNFKIITVLYLSFTIGILTLFWKFVNERPLLSITFSETIVFATIAILIYKIADYANYEASFKNETLLNCGVIGGKFEIMQAFINQLCTIHLNFNSDNTSAYTGDMGAFNYLIRTKYNDSVIHGAPINTEFKKYSENKSCWFKHK